jgi:hypothetical protein
LVLGCEKAVVIFQPFPNCFRRYQFVIKFDLGRYQFVIKKLGKFTTWGNLFANVVLTGKAKGRPKK